MTKARKTAIIAMLRRVKRRILARPEKYSQDIWCGTAYCIGGHIAIDQGAKLKIDNHGYGSFILNGRRLDVSRFAKKKIGKEGAPVWLFNEAFLGRPNGQLLAGVTLKTPEQNAALGAMAIETYIQEELS